MPRVAAVFCSLVVAVGATAVIAHAVLPDSPVYYKGFKQPPRVEPKRIDVVIGAGTFFWVTGLDRWFDWSSHTSRATADGTIHLNNCRPDCADGKYRKHPARVRVSHIGTCDNQLRYKRIRVVVKHSRVPTLKEDVDCDGLQQ